MPSLQLAAVDFDPSGKKTLAAASGAAEQEGGFLDALLEVAAGGDRDGKKEVLKLLDAAASGKGLPGEDGSPSTALRAMLAGEGGGESLAALAAEWRSAERAAGGDDVDAAQLGERAAGLRGYDLSRASMPADFAREGDSVLGEAGNPEFPAKPQEGVRPGRSALEAMLDAGGGGLLTSRVLLGGQSDTSGGGDEPVWSLELAASGDSLNPEKLASERAQVLDLLAELEAQGLAGRELAEALEGRLAELTDAGQLQAFEVIERPVGGHVGGQSVEGLQRLAESSGPEARAGGLWSLGGSLGGEVFNGASERTLTQNVLGEQLTREVRAGQLLGSVASGTATLGTEAGSQLGVQGGGGERLGHGGYGGSAGGQQGGQGGNGTESLLQALERAQERREESGAAAGGGRGGEFGSLLAAAQGLDGGPRGGPVQLSLQQPPGQRGFTPAVGERIDWMVKEGVKEARLQLNPPGMGHLEIKISVGEERTAVQIIAHNATAREALQEDLQRLRQMLAEEGHADVDVEVSDGGTEERDEEGPTLADAAGEARRGGDGAVGEPEAAAAESSSGAAGRGLVDHYA
ncbi:flagellar hook-length control protein FliK [Halorhodospira abdelmalekii]|uniref:flagellar hook-length control protein FliK n=1 Tax=Halorhodospira abdelmalekii TaxID=421629 RepID=UPI0019067835|nr:flagellar hook-length control protein FliK [Halorhodospira abdelmalekii]